jgi:hypothetical protein
MPRFIELTVDVVDAGLRKVLLNVEHVASVSPIDRGGCAVSLTRDEDRWHVTESYEVVRALLTGGGSDAGGIR